MDWAVLGHARMCMCVFEQKKEKKKREGRRRKTAIGRCLGLVRCLVTADFARGVVAVNLVRLEEHVQALLVPCKRVVRNPEGQARCRHEDAVGVERGRERARRGGEGRKGGGKEASCVCVCVCVRFRGCALPRSDTSKTYLLMKSSRPFRRSSIKSGANIPGNRIDTCAQTQTQAQRRQCSNRL